MMAERTLIVVSDFDLFKLNEEQREKLIAFLEDVPPYCCVVFLYDTVEYKPNRTMKKLYKAVTDHVEAVEFRPADNSDLVVFQFLKGLVDLGCLFRVCHGVSSIHR